jgi:hypothetical protein
MVRHLIITVVALLVGIAPAVRAACDVSCVGGSHRTQAVAADHCDKTADHDVPAPDRGCKHEHVQSVALAGTAKVLPSPAAPVVVGASNAVLPPLQSHIVARSVERLARPIVDRGRIPLRI